MNPIDTVWVFGDQLNRRIASLAKARPEQTRVLMIESAAKLRQKAWHRQRVHLYLAAMRRFARELDRAGFEVDYRLAASFEAGLAAHRAQYRPAEIVAMEPLSWDAEQRFAKQGVHFVRSNQFLCHRDEFAGWAEGQRTMRMEGFYRWQRRRLGILMEGDEPAGGRWNFDAENREPPPAKVVAWPRPRRARLDDLDRAVLDELPERVVGAAPDGTWATSRRGALARLRHFIDEALPRFGPHQDAMVEDSWHLAHALLSPYLNIGLLHPREVCDAAEAAWRAGQVPLASAEGFIRQIIGWREYVWGLFWLWMPEYRRWNSLGAKRPLPPLFDLNRRPEAHTKMRCVDHALRGVDEHGYAHHIQRLMVLGNLGLLAGIRPGDLVDWMWRSFVDGAEWVMMANVTSMALYADGGRMSTKPYAAGGAYLSRMSTHCSACRFNPKRRVGDDACPFTTLYWDFLARNRETLAGNPRLAPQLRQLDRLADRDALRVRADEVLGGLDRGTL